MQKSRSNMNVTSDRDAPIVVSGTSEGNKVTFELSSMLESAPSPRRDRLMNSNVRRPLRCRSCPHDPLARDSPELEMVSSRGFVFIGEPAEATSRCTRHTPR